MDEEIEIRSLSDLEEKLGEVIFPFDAVVPDITNEWFSALTSTSALIGKTTVKVFGT